jgi:hypothetical protein
MGAAGGGGVEFVGYNDSNIQGSFTLDYPTGTQSGDLLFLFCGSDFSVSAGTPSGWTEVTVSISAVRIYYRTAGGETSVITPPSNESVSGAIVCSFRGVTYVQSNTSNDGDNHTPPTPFSAFSGATVGNSCVCFVYYDDDIQSGDATQTDFSVGVSDFYGSSAGSGISMNVTYAFDVIDSTTFTPPDLNASGIAVEKYVSMAFEIAET